MSTAEEQKKKLKEIITDVEADSIKFAKDSIKDSQLREKYIETVKARANAIAEETAENARNVERGAQTAIWKAGARKASEFRNEYLNSTRANNSAVARSFSKMLKEEGLDFISLRHKYMRQRVPHAERFEGLNLAVQEEIYGDIIRASGRTSASVNKWARMFGKAGKGVLFVTAAIAIFQVVEAENPLAELVRQAAGIGGGIGGGWAGGEAGAEIGSLAGPGGALAGAIIGAIVGGIIGSEVGGKVVELTFENLFGFYFPGNEENHDG